MSARTTPRRLRCVVQRPHCGVLSQRMRLGHVLRAGPLTVGASGSGDKRGHSPNGATKGTVGTGLPAGTTISSQLSGTTGGVGTYQLSNSGSVGRLLSVDNEERKATDTYTLNDGSAETSPVLSDTINGTTYTTPENIERISAGRHSGEGRRGNGNVGLFGRLRVRGTRDRKRQHDLHVRHHQLGNSEPGRLPVVLSDDAVHSEQQKRDAGPNQVLLRRKRRRDLYRRGEHRRAPDSVREPFNRCLANQRQAGKGRVMKIADPSSPMNPMPICS